MHLECRLLWILPVFDICSAVYSSYSSRNISVPVLLEMLKQRHDFHRLHSLILRYRSCPLFIHFQNRWSRNAHTLSSVVVPVGRLNCGDCRRIEQSNRCHCRPLSVPKRFHSALHHSLNVRPSMLPTRSGCDTGLQWPYANLQSVGARWYGRLQPNVRWFTLSPKAIVEASPWYIQPYLRLIRLDRPIGTFLKPLFCFFYM